MITQLKKYRNLTYEERESKIYGVVIAIVTNNKDPDGLARVKLKFPWLGEASDKESNWARIATFMAGNERGSYFIPEIDDEVLVAFENGDINYPYVLGALWNGKDKTTENNENGKNDIRSITSRSGHKITLNDKEGEEIVEIIDKSKKRRITFKVKEKLLEIFNEEESGEIKIYSKGKITIESDNSIDLIAKKDINLSAKENLLIEANNITTKSKVATKIDVGTKLDITSKAPMKIESKATLDLKASAITNIKSSGPLNISSDAMASLKGSIATKLG